ncbi:MAG TPA: ArsA family ATPase, partial [Candidatus Dormibacteraeota bacterium]
HEVVGLDSLGEMADSIFGPLDPAAIMYHEVPQRVRKSGSEYELLLHLPFVSRAELGVTHREGELFVTVGPYKREISLPRVLKGKAVTAAKLEEGMLRVVFGGAKS